MTQKATRIRTVGIGVGLAGDAGNKMADIRVYAENGSVLVWAELNPESKSFEAMQYMTPEEAMSFAKAFERCAIQALKDRAELF